jgi:hypothetical protein
VSQSRGKRSSVAGADEPAALASELGQPRELWEDRERGEVALAGDVAADRERHGDYQRGRDRDELVRVPGDSKWQQRGHHDRHRGTGLAPVAKPAEPALDALAIGPLLRGKARGCGVSARGKHRSVRLVKLVVG